MDEQHPPRIGKCEACGKEYAIQVWQQAHIEQVDSGYISIPNCPHCGYSPQLPHAVYQILDEDVQVALSYQNLNECSMTLPEFVLRLEVNNVHLATCVLAALRNMCPLLFERLSQNNKQPQLRRSIETLIKIYCKVYFPSCRVDAELMKTKVIEEIQYFCRQLNER